MMNDNRYKASGATHKNGITATSGAVFSGTIVQAGGELIVTQSGNVLATTISSGGSAVVQSGGTLRLSSKAGQGTVADLWLPVMINGDMAFFQGLMKEMLEEEDRRPGQVFDHDFIKHHTAGLDALIAQLRASLEAEPQQENLG